MTKTKKYKRYSTEFKREALKRSSEDGVTDKQIWESVAVNCVDGVMSFGCQVMMRSPRQAALETMKSFV